MAQDSELHLLQPALLSCIQYTYTHTYIYIYICMLSFGTGFKGCMSLFCKLCSIAGIWEPLCHSLQSPLRSSDCMWQPLRYPRLFSAIQIPCFIGFSLGAIVLSPSLQPLLGRVAQLLAEALLARATKPERPIRQEAEVLQLRARPRPLFLPS